MFYIVVLLIIVEGTACASITNGDSSTIVGVKPGDFNVYGYNVTLFSNDTNAMLSTIPYYQWFSSLDSCQVLVESISDTNITARFTYTLKNGTEDMVTRWIDVGANMASDSEAAKGYFVALNSTIFNETMIRTYLGVSREVNHFYGGFVNGTYVWSHNGTEHILIYNYTMDLYADKSTGTLAEYTETMSNKNETYFSEMTFHIIVTESNIIPEFPSFLIIPLFTTLTLFAVIVYKRKLSKIAAVS